MKRRLTFSLLLVIAALTALFSLNFAGAVITTVTTTTSFTLTTAAYITSFTSVVSGTTTTITSLSTLNPTAYLSTTTTQTQPGAFYPTVDMTNVGILMVLIFVPGAILMMTPLGLIGFILGALTGTGIGVAMNIAPLWLMIVMSFFTFTFFIMFKPGQREN